MLLVTYDLWSLVSENWRELLDAFVNTLKVPVIAIAGAFVIGSCSAPHAYRIPVVSQLAAVYVEIIRNTPILVQIFMLYFALPQAGIRLIAFTAAWLAVMLWGGAFTENFRAGFEAVPTRYREAAHALGFGSLGTFLNVTLPIGGRISLPSSINTYISIVKKTSLMYVIGYPELTTTAINIANLTSPKRSRRSRSSRSATSPSSGASRPPSGCSSPDWPSRRRGRCRAGSSPSGATSSPRACRRPCSSRPSPSWAAR